MTVLHNGELLVLPTETVYGVAADPNARGALDALYRAKHRPQERAIAILVEGVEAARRDGARFNAISERLAANYWPGPLTLVLGAKEGERGYRVPDHPVPLALLRAWGGPLAVSSANRSGYPPAQTADEAEEALGECVALVLDAGPVSGGVASTVVRVREETCEILREGAIPAAIIRECTR